MNKPKRIYKSGPTKRKLKKNTCWNLQKMVPNKLNLVFQLQSEVSSIVWSLFNYPRSYLHNYFEASSQNQRK